MLGQRRSLLAAAAAAPPRAESARALHDIRVMMQTACRWTSFPSRRSAARAGQQGQNRDFPAGPLPLLADSRSGPGRSRDPGDTVTLSRGRPGTRALPGPGRRIPQIPQVTLRRGGFQFLRGLVRARAGLGYCTVLGIPPMPQVALAVSGPLGAFRVTGPESYPRPATGSLGGPSTLRVSRTLASCLADRPRLMLHPWDVWGGV